jgi:N-acetylmuramoyl-L-alanine amidase
MKYQPNPNNKIRKNTIHGIVIHSMGETVAGKSAADFLEEYGLSAHYLITPEGEVTETVSPEKVAFHAGVSEWLGESHLNKSYIGIELLVKGEHTFSSLREAVQKSDSFSELQFEACSVLCRELIGKYPDISAARFVRHSDVSGDRVRGKGKGKFDVGSGFPFSKLKESIFDL